MSASDTGQTRIDLHTHTTASDGLLSPRELVRAAAERGVTFLGIADHDTTAGLAEAIDEAAGLDGISVVPAVELSASSTHGGDFHLLGYCVQPEGTTLQKALERFRRDREARIERMVTRLRDHGVPITLEQVEANAAGGAVSRAHVGRVLIELGVVDNVDDAFSTWLGRGRPGFEPRKPFSAHEAVELILAAGGVPVLAHPLTMGDFQQQLPELIDAGLKGIEVYYGPYGDDERAILANVAGANGLIATGGSDYHGPEHREGRDLGAVDVPLTAIEHLRSAVPGCL